MNQIGKLYLNHQTDVITTSSQFQTTLDFIKWPLDQKNYIIDTPGIINPKNYGAYLENESVKILTVKKYIKPRTFQLNPDQTIFLGGLASIDFYGENKINASFFVSNELYLHRTKTIQKEHIKTGVAQNPLPANGYPPQWQQSWQQIYHLGQHRHPKYAHLFEGLTILCSSGWRGLLHIPARP